MGLYNLWEDKLPSPLKNKKCYLCGSDISFINQNPEMDAFEYRCINCNPNVIIQISGDLLTDSIYEDLFKRKDFLKLIHERVRISQNKNFLITSIDAEQYLTSFTLSNEHPIQEFSLQKSFSFIVIRRIEINSLLRLGMRPNEWAIAMMELDPVLVIKYYNIAGRTKSFMVGLNAHISPNHRFPILEFTNELIAPIENTENYSSIPKTYDFLSIELEWNHTINNREIEISVFFDSTEGVKNIQ